jgi:hypothetical protein
MGKLSLVGFVPPLPEVVETREPEWTPAIVKLRFGEIFFGLLQSDRKFFEGVNNETAVRGVVSMDHAYLVEKAIHLFEESGGVKIAEKDYGRIGRGLNAWRKDCGIAQHQRRELAKQAALAALAAPPIAAE